MRSDDDEIGLEIAGHPDDLFGWSATRHHDPAANRGKLGIFWNSLFQRIPGIALGAEDNIGIQQLTRIVLGVKRIRHDHRFYDVTEDHLRVVIGRHAKRVRNGMIAGL